MAARQIEQLVKMAGQIALNIGAGRERENQPLDKSTEFVVR